jgi:hypothetical protein
MADIYRCIADGKNRKNVVAKTKTIYKNKPIRKKDKNLAI